MWHATKPALLPSAELAFFCTWFAHTMLLSVNRFSVLNQTQSIHNIRPIHDAIQDCNLLKRSQWSKWSDSSSQAPLISRALPWLCEASSSGCCAVLIAGEKRGSAKMQIPRKAQPSKVGKTRSCRRLQSREPDQISKRSRNEREGPCHDSGKQRQKSTTPKNSKAAMQESSSKSPNTSRRYTDLISNSGWNSDIVGDLVTGSFWKCQLRSKMAIHVRTRSLQMNKGLDIKNISEEWVEQSFEHLSLR